MLKQQLINNANFLKLSLEHENSIAPFSFNVDIDVSVDTGINLHVELKPAIKHHVTVIDTGIIQFEPVNQLLPTQQLTQDDEQRSIVLSCGVHGNETGPIEICNHLIEQLLTGKIALTHRVLFIIGNPKAINQKKRFVDENLNSVFALGDDLFIDTEADKPKQNSHYERERAYVIEQAVSSFYGDY